MHGSCVNWMIVPALIVALLAPAAAWAQEDEAADAANGEAEADEALALDEEEQVLLRDGEPVEIVIDAVQGLVQVRMEAEAAWERAEVGMELVIGAALRTGPRSVVRFRVGPHQWITLDRLGTVEVLEAIEAEGVVSTDIGMPYGRTRYEVQSVEDLEHTGQIRSPLAALATSGSQGFLEDYADRPPRAGADSGDIAFVNVAGQFIALDPPSEIEGRQTAGGQYQFAEGTYNPYGPSLDELEFELMGVYPSGAFDLKLLGFEAHQAHAQAAAGFGRFNEILDARPPVEEPEMDMGPLVFQTQWEDQFANDALVFTIDDGMGGTLSLETPFTESGGVFNFDAPGSGEPINASGTWAEPVPFSTYTAIIENTFEPGTEIGPALLNFFQGTLEDDGFIIHNDERFEVLVFPGETEVMVIEVPPVGD